MEKNKIHELVKNLEPYFFGYVADKDRLKNDMGLELLFQSSWNGKTRVIGLGGKTPHSIGCSFTKPLGRMASDVMRRLLPSYRDDFLEYKRELQQLKEKEAFERKKLAALAQVLGGKVTDHPNYGKQEKCVKFTHGFIFQNYDDNYKIKIQVDFGKALKVLPVLKEALN